MATQCWHHLDEVAKRNNVEFRALAPKKVVVLKGNSTLFVVRSIMIKLMTAEEFQQQLDIAFSMEEIINGNESV